MENKEAWFIGVMICSILVCIFCCRLLFFTLPRQRKELEQTWRDHIHRHLQEKLLEADTKGAIFGLALGIFGIAMTAIALAKILGKH